MDFKNILQINNVVLITNSCPQNITDYLYVSGVYDAVQNSTAAMDSYLIAFWGNRFGIKSNKSAFKEYLSLNLQQLTRLEAFRFIFLD